MLTKSQSFTAYNYYKSQSELDEARTNRALGYLLSLEKSQRLSQYNATIERCDCLNYQYHRHCKHTRARKMQVLGRKYFTISFWAKTYDPGQLLTTSEIELPILVEEMIYSHIEITKDDKTRPAQKNNFDVITLIRDNGYKLAWVALVNTRNGRAGWNGKFELTFYLD